VLQVLAAVMKRSLPHELSVFQTAGIWAVACQGVCLKMESEPPMVREHAFSPREEPSAGTEVALYDQARSTWVATGRIAEVCVFVRCDSSVPLQNLSLYLMATSLSKRKRALFLSSMRLRMQGRDEEVKAAETVEGNELRHSSRERLILVRITEVKVPSAVLVAYEGNATLDNARVVVFWRRSSVFPVLCQLQEGNDIHEVCESEREDGHRQGNEYTRVKLDAFHLLARVQEALPSAHPFAKEFFRCIPNFLFSVSLVSHLRAVITMMLSSPVADML